VRSRVNASAAKRDLDIQIGAVRPGWFAVRLLDVTVTARGGGARAALAEIRVGITVGLRPSSIDARGGSVELDGSLDALRRALEPSGANQPTSSADGIPLHGQQLAVAWHDGPRVSELKGLSFDRDPQGIRLAADEAMFRDATARLTLESLSSELGPDRAFRRLHARSATVGWDGPILPPADDAGQVESTASAAPNPAPEPLPQLPDPRALRARVGGLGEMAARHFPVDAEVDVQDFTWQVGSSDPRKALTFGPGPLSIHRESSHLDVQYSSRAGGDGTSLTLRAVLPTDDGDASLSVEGGPVSLAVLGVHEGAVGFFDVDRATVGGRATVRLAGDGSALTFDLEDTARNLSLQQPSLASEPVRGMDVQLTARGTLDDAGTLRLDDFGATLGLLHLGGSGVLEEHSDHALASFRFELPSATCKSLLESIPTAFLPDLQGAHWAGTFGARGSFSFDTRDPDALQLGYDVQDQCRAIDVPPELARSRFKQPFQQKIYLPDGSLAEQATGPGTANWTQLASISPYVPMAVMTTEDGAFPYHHGFNVAAIKASIIANIKAHRFVRGASTITMQLAKNLFLTRQKTVSRKLEEVVLTDYLEQVFSKDELMELYLNVVEFGPAVYGITAASEYYFGRTPAELDVAESLFLSSLLPSPRRYGAMRDLDEAPEGWMRGLRNLIHIAHKRHLLSDAELEEALGEKVVFWHGGVRPPARPPARQRSPLDVVDPSDTPEPIDAP
jgi:hypothetical protein